MVMLTIYESKNIPVQGSLWTEEVRLKLCIREKVGTKFINQVETHCLQKKMLPIIHVVNRTLHVKGVDGTFHLQ